MDLDEGLVCGACFDRLDRRVVEPCGCDEYQPPDDDATWLYYTCTCVYEPETDLATRARASLWHCIIGSRGEHWFCPKHTLAVRSVDAILPVNERTLVRGLVAVVEVVG